MVVCKKCGYDLIQEDLHLHHLVPISIGGVDSNGRRWLCKKCHSIIHNMMLGQIWKFIPEEQKEKARQGLKGFTLWWIDK